MYQSVRSNTFAPERTNSANERSENKSSNAKGTASNLRIMKMEKVFPNLFFPPKFRDRSTWKGLDYSAWLC